MCYFIAKIVTDTQVTYMVWNALMWNYLDIYC